MSKPVINSASFPASTNPGQQFEVQLFGSDPDARVVHFEGFASDPSNQQSDLFSFDVPVPEPLTYQLTTSDPNTVIIPNPNGAPNSFLVTVN